MLAFKSVLSSLFWFTVEIGHFYCSKIKSKQVNSYSETSKIFFSVAFRNDMLVWLAYQHWTLNYSSSSLSLINTVCRYQVSLYDVGNSFLLPTSSSLSSMVYILALCLFLHCFALPWFTAKRHQLMWATGMALHGKQSSAFQDKVTIWLPQNFASNSDKVTKNKLTCIIGADA